MRPKGIDDLNKIVILNPKGGSGKTTVATNLASIYALRSPPPTLIDCDPQGFCLRWLNKRAPTRPRIHGIAAVDEAPASFLASTQHVPADSRTLIFDLPAAIPAENLYSYTHFADRILIPIAPSSIDVHAAAQLIGELLLDVQLDRRERKVAIIANRVNAQTRSFKMLMRFLTSLEIPVVSVLRDSQNYVTAAGLGMGVCELPAYKVRDDILCWKAILAWLDRRESPSSTMDAKHPAFSHYDGDEAFQRPTRGQPNS